MRVVVPFLYSFQDYPSNHGGALVIYCLGCSHKCKGCHNPELASIDKWTGLHEDVNAKSLMELVVKEAPRYRTKQIVLSGGDPLHLINREVVAEFTRLNESDYDFNICIYTGYEIDEVKTMNLGLCDFIKCGKYEERLQQIPEKTDKQIVFGSSNQKLYDSNFNLLSIDGIYNFQGGN